MRVMQVLALLLIVGSALSFGLTNWFVETESTSIFGGEHYNWFFGYYYKSFIVNPSSLLDYSFYNPFPSALGGDISSCMWHSSLVRKNGESKTAMVLLRKHA